MARRFKTIVLSSFIRYMKLTHELPVGKYRDQKESEIDKDIAAGVEALIWVGNPPFWGWDDGFGILFWRWTLYIRHECRDRYKWSVKEKLPRITKKQRMAVDELECDMVKKKTEKVRNRWYITSGTNLSLTSFFHVPKVNNATRLVYDILACGLNNSLWDPKFWMPSVENVLYISFQSFWFGDMDSSEMFQNYILSEKSQPYAGVDVSWAKIGKALRWK